MVDTFRVIIELPLCADSYFEGDTVGKNSRTLTVRLDADRYDQLEQLACKEGFSVSVIVRHLVYRFLDEKRRWPGVSS
jgi:hypothetical protein